MDNQILVVERGVAGDSDKQILELEGLSRFANIVSHLDHTIGKGTDRF